MLEIKTAQIILPELGEGITKAKVACWHASAGERVTAGDDVVEVVTDKATFGIEAEVSGILTEILVGEGAEARVGEILAVIDPAAEKERDEELRISREQRIL